MSYKLIRREEWGMEPFIQQPLALPLQHVYIHHSVTPGSWDGIYACRTIDRLAKDSKNGFPYSYAIHPYDGTVYEGKGGYKGSHTLDHNSIGFGVVFLGDFEPRITDHGALIGLDHLTDTSIDAFRWLIDLLHHEGKLAYGHVTSGHLEVMRPGYTQCPGKTIMANKSALLVPWEPPVPSPIPTPDPEEEEDMRPNMLLRKDGEDLVVAQFDAQVVRVNGPQFTEFQKQGVPVVTVTDGKDWAMLTENRNKSNG